MSFGHFPVYAFIASSSEGLPVAERIHTYLDEGKVDGHKLACVDIWDDIFPPSESVIETLETTAQQVDFALFVLTPDDVLVSRGEETPAPRDNINFELGFFMGKLGRNRCLVMRPEDVKVKMPSDLAGLTCVTYTYDPLHEYASSIRAPAVKLIQRIKAVGPRGPTSDFLTGWGYVMKDRSFYANVDPDRLRPYATRKLSVLVVSFTGEGTTFLSAKPIALSEPWKITPSVPNKSIPISVSCASLAKIIRKGDKVWGVVMLVPYDIALADVTCIEDIISRGGRIVDGKGNYAS